MKQDIDKAVPPGIYRHYKGNRYQVLATARHSETEELMVIYRCLYGDHSVWVRPLEMYLDTVLVDNQVIPRFRLELSAPAGGTEEGGDDFASS